MTKASASPAAQAALRAAMIVSMLSRSFAASAMLELLADAGHGRSRRDPAIKLVGRHVEEGVDVNRGQERRDAGEGSTTDLGPDAPTGRFTMWENQTIPW